MHLNLEDEKNFRNIKTESEGITVTSISFDRACQVKLRLRSLFKMLSYFWRSSCRRVPNMFFGMRDLGYFRVGIRDFGVKRGRDSGL